MELDKILSDLNLEFNCCASHAHAFEDLPMLFEEEDRKPPMIHEMRKHSLGILMGICSVWGATSEPGIEGRLGALEISHIAGELLRRIGELHSLLDSAHELVPVRLDFGSIEPPRVPDENFTKAASILEEAANIAGCIGAHPLSQRIIDLRYPRKPEWKAEKPE